MDVLLHPQSNRARVRRTGRSFTGMFLHVKVTRLQKARFLNELFLIGGRLNIFRRSNRSDRQLNRLVAQRADGLRVSHRKQFGRVPAFRRNSVNRLFRRVQVDRRVGHFDQRVDSDIQFRPGELLQRLFFRHFERGHLKAEEVGLGAERFAFAVDVRSNFDTRNNGHRRADFQQFRRRAIVKFDFAHVVGADFDVRRLAVFRQEYLERASLTRLERILFNHPVLVTR